MALATLERLALDGLHSPHSRRSYTLGLHDFLAWVDASGGPDLTLATVNRYAAHLRDEQGLSTAAVVQRLKAVRRLVSEARKSGFVRAEIAAAILSEKLGETRGERTGLWLTRDQAQALLDRTAAMLPAVKAARDLALLSVLLGTGLRREEAATLTFAHVAQRDGRWAIVDIVGKGNKRGSVPMDAWTKVAIDAWAEAAGGIESGAIFRPLRRGTGRLDGAQMSTSAIGRVVHEAGERIGVPELAAHDLRRTFAKLAEQGGARLAQIQLSLRHERLDTTQKYLGAQTDWHDAPCDHLGLRLRLA